jgi:hypothetical protein
MYNTLLATSTGRFINAQVFDPQMVTAHDGIV